MSCMVMDAEPLAALANATTTLLNCGFDYFGFCAPDSLHAALECCRDGYGHYSAVEIYRSLYSVNARAYNVRYKDDPYAVDNDAPTIDISKYVISKQPVFSDHHHAVQPWHYHLAKLLDFWLYQTDEEATWKDPIRSAMAEFQTDLFSFIVQRSASYRAAPSWGRL